MNELIDGRNHHNIITLLGQFLYQRQPEIEYIPRGVVNDEYFFVHILHTERFSPAKLVFLAKFFRPFFVNFRHNGLYRLLL